MDKKIWAATFIDGSGAAYADVSVDRLGTPEGKRFAELDNKGRVWRTADEQKEYDEIWRMFSAARKELSSCESEVPQHLIPSRCFFGKGMTRRNYENQIKGEIFRTQLANYVCKESSAVALSKVNLGMNQLFKMGVYDEKQALIEGFQLYMLELREKKSFLVEQSLKNMGLTYASGRGGYYSADHRMLRKGPIIFSRAVFDYSVDIWCEKLLSNTIFITDKLKGELEATGAAKMWKLVECKVEA